MKKSYYIVLFVSQTIILLVLSFVLFLIGFLVLTEKCEGGEEKNVLNKYQILRMNPSTKETTFGIISSFSQQLSNAEDDFIYYDLGEEEGSFLISHIGSKEFYCTGSCYCSAVTTDDMRRRSSTVILKNTLSYLLVGISSYLVYERASEYFQDECEKQLTFSGECPSHAIESKVEECNEASPSTSSSAPTGSLEEVEEELSPRKSSGDEYLCSGKCTANKFFYQGLEITPEAIQKVSETIDRFKCENLEHKTTLKIDEILQSKSFKSDNLNPMDFIDLHDPSRIAFYYLQEFLSPFCLKVAQKKVGNGLVTSDDPGEYIDQRKNKKKKKKSTKKKRWKAKEGKVKVSFCSAKAVPEEMQTMCRKV